jgi:hypothetical protein
MKKFFATGLLLMALLTGSVFGATLSTNVTAGGTHLLSTSGAVISSITVTAGSTDPVTIKFYDNSAADITYTNAAYTTFQQYTTNLVTTNTTSTGVINIMTNSVKYNAALSVAAATNDRPISSTVSAVAGGQGTSTGNLIMTRGIVFTSDTNATVTITYKGAFNN